MGADDGKRAMDAVYRAFLASERARSRIWVTQTASELIYTAGAIPRSLKTNLTTARKVSWLSLSDWS